MGISLHLQICSTSKGAIVHQSNSAPTNVQLVNVYTILSPPPPHSNASGAASVFPFSRERGYFLALVSGRFP